MCDEWGTQCSGDGCKPGPVILACEPLVHCVNCTIGDFAGVGLPTQDAAGKWQIPAGVTRGLLVHNESGQFGCWLIEDPGATELQPFDRVLAINGVAPEVACFEAIAKTAGKPATFTLTVRRGNSLLTIKHERS